ncbi:MAG: hypothetical protein EA406_02295 [Rhodospirillales bacterium]|nr:MAG: hypothetical protein EA406_02295 [Rhodospirillales bacterium]
MNRKSTAITAAIAAVVLAGCTQAVRMQSATDSVVDTGIRSNFAYAAGIGEMNTVIIGNPFDLPAAQVQQTVLGAMQGNHFGPRTRFTTEPSERARSDYRIVVVFDFPIGVPQHRVCGPTEDMPQAAGGSRLGMTTVFCWRDQVISWVNADTARPASPDDRAFRTLVANSMWNLLPTQDHMSSRDDTWM